jgi:hypothetical protein
MDSFIDRSLWPCACPDMFYCLQEQVKDIAHLSETDEDSVEYRIHKSMIPTGTYLNQFTGFRNFELSFHTLHKSLQMKIKHIVMYFDGKPLELLEHKDENIMSFSMFQGTRIFPIFALTQSDLTFRIYFQSELTREEVLHLPQSFLMAQGLLFTMNDFREKPCFLAASKDSIFTWDGSKCQVVHKASFSFDDERTETRNEIKPRKQVHYFDYQSDSSESMSDDTDPLQEHRRWHLLHSSTTNFRDLYTYLEHI